MLVQLKMGKIRRLDQDGELEKRCPRCREWWPADIEFYNHSSSNRDGLNGWCKACVVEDKRAKELANA